MAEPSPSPGPLTIARVLIGSLMVGLLTATGVMFFLVHSGIQKPVPNMEILLLVLAALWPITAAVAVLMKGVLTRQARAEWEVSGGRGEPDDLFPRYMTSLILRAALLEGPGLFGAIAFLLTGNVLALIAPALSLAGLGLLFPSEERFRGFVRDVTGGL